MSLLDERLDAHTADIARYAGALNLANAGLVATMAAVVDDDAWSGPGIRSVEQWLSYKAGVTTSRAAMIVEVARRRDLFPAVIARFDAGEYSLEQVAELVKAPEWADAQIVEWGLVATPARIRKSIKLHFGGSDTRDEPTADAERDTEVDGDPDWVHSGVTDDHRWRVRGEFDLARGTTINQALIAARETLWERGQRTITVADCLAEVAERYLDGVPSPLRRDRHKIWLHLDATTGASVTSTGVRIPDSVRDRICCDGIIAPVWEHDGVPFNLGRTQRLVPERTRRLIMLRDGGCRVPGCGHDRIVEIHHVISWLNGGPTDTWNLVALCPRHHRMHHNARLGIVGNADQADGLVFTDHNGRRLPGCGPPDPPTQLPTPNPPYTPPSMGRVDWNWVGLGWTPPPTTNS